MSVYPFIAGLLCLSVAAISVPSLAAQETGSGQEKVYAPFVSKIRAAVKDDLVKISWSDSRDAKGSVEIYRAAVPITDESYKKAIRLAEVPYGAGSYLDHPPSEGPWYYWVAARTEEGTRYDVVVPFSNATGTPALTTPRTTQNVAPAQSSTVAQEKPKAGPYEPSVTKLKAKVEGDAIILTFQVNRQNPRLVLYRSASQISKVADLLDAIILQASTSVSSTFTDYPVPGIGYFYAILAEGDLTAGDAAIVLGSNATRASAEVPIGRFRVGLPAAPRELRSMPLPLLSIDAALDAGASGQAPVEPHFLSAEASKAVSSLVALAPIPPARERKPRVFPQDLQAPGGGEEYALRSIVQGVFARKSWPEAQKQLSSYLSLSRSPAVEARARFYLGQAYYFSKQYREALFEFLMVQTQYYAEGQEWIQAILPRLQS